MNSGASGCLFTTDHMECFIKVIFIRHKRLKYRISWAGKRRRDNNLDYYPSDHFYYSLCSFQEWSKPPWGQWKVSSWVQGTLLLLSSLGKVWGSVRSSVHVQTCSEGVWRSHLLTPGPPLRLGCNLTWLFRAPLEPLGRERPQARVSTP